MKDVVRSDLDAWAAKGVAVGDLIFIVSDGQFPGIEEGCFVTLFSGVRPLCEARIGRGLRNMEVKDFCKDPPARTLRMAQVTKDGPGKFGYMDLTKLLPASVAVAHA
jgi:hypothetical protein